MKRVRVTDVRELVMVLEILAESNDRRGVESSDVYVKGYFDGKSDAYMLAVKMIKEGLLDEKES